MRLDVVAFLYASLVFFGGIFAYVKTGSTVSVVMGVSIGSLLYYSASLCSREGMQKNVKPIIGLSGLLTSVMAFRYIKTGKIVPAGVLALVSFVVMVRYVYIWRNLSANLIAVKEREKRK